MKPRHKYVRYDETDEVYFGCAKVICAEWDYIEKRRASQTAAELEQAASAGKTGHASPRSGSSGGFWASLARIFSPLMRGKQNRPSAQSQIGSNCSQRLPPSNLCGIALSGGGIRSASFCLGVLQALSYAGWLKKLDYLSTVSGGGYIGGTLSWLLHRQWIGPHGEEITFGLDRKNFPFGSYPMVGSESKSEEGDKASWDVYKGRMLKYVRQHASYLTQGERINVISICAVALRNALVGLLVYGGLLVVLFYLFWPILFDSIAPGEAGQEWKIWHFDWFPNNANFAQGITIWLSLFFLLAAATYPALTLLPKKMSTGYLMRYFLERVMGGALAIMVCLTVVGLVPFVYKWIDEAGRSKHETVAIMTLSGTAGTLGEVSLAGKLTQSVGPRLADGRVKTCTENTPTSADSNAACGDKKNSEPSAWNLGSLIENTAFLVGGLSTILGAIASLLAFRQEEKRKKTVPPGILVALASFGLIFGVLLLAYHFATWLHCNLDDWRSKVGIVFLYFFLIRLTNLNYLSIHRFYRDRLMETFAPDLPDAIDVNGPVPGVAKSADWTTLHEMLNEHGEAGELGPYHIINANIVLVSSKIPKFRERGGDNFILTPKYCGSNATGWCETKGSPYDDMTLPTAIAISGAAINSNAGPAGTGVTRTPWLSFLMGIFNLRFGYWVDNPAPNRDRLDRLAKELGRALHAQPPVRAGEGPASYSLREFWHSLFVVYRWPLNQIYMMLQGMLSLSLCAGPNKPNAFYPGLFEVYLRKNLDERSRMVQLSDGGHFENFGLYELVRRRLKLIIVCDGSADPVYGFDDLANAMEKVRADFGAIVSWHCTDLETLTPKSVIEAAKETDKRMTYADQGYLMGKIRYADDSEGTLLFLTTTFFKELSADLYSYRKNHNEFPDQPTSDQFFDERQFEAYRELGFQTAHAMMCDEKVRVNNDVESTLGIPQVEWREK